MTSRGLGERRAWRALKAALPESWLEGSGFRGVLLVEAEGDPLALAARVVEACGEEVGHVTPIFAEVETDVAAIGRAAADIAATRVGAGESFCFRIHRRGWEPPEPAAPGLERVIGGFVFEALERRLGARPTVDLEDPDVALVAEVLGRRTLVGAVPRSLRAAAAGG